jgi:VanZ family protein
MIQHLPTWYRRFARWIFVPALAVVVWGELKPSTHGPDVIWDKLLHFTAYFGLAGIATVALGRQKASLWAAFALAVFGGILEIVQSFVGRDAEWGDEIANVLGAGVGLAAAWASVWVVEQLRSHSASRGEGNETVR